MTLFIDAGESGVIREGVRYLRIEGSFYFMIGVLFLLYGLYRAIGKPGMSVVLTVISLGTRVGLAYGLAAVPAVGVVGIWWAVPIAGCWPTVWEQVIIFFRIRPGSGLSGSILQGKKGNKKTVKKRKKVLDNFDLPWYYITCELRSSLVTSWAEVADLADAQASACLWSFKIVWVQVPSSA